MRVGFFGTPAIAARYLEAIAQRHQVAGVVPQPDRPAGRSAQPQPSPVKQVALRVGAPVFQPERGHCPGSCAELELGTPDICVVVAFGQRLPCGVRECSIGRCVNVHYSLLPKLRGAAPVQHAILQGLERTGVTIQHVAPGWDEGDIILRRAVEIYPEDTTGSLTERLTELGLATLLDALDLLAAGTAARTPQDPAEASFAPAIKKEDGMIVWGESAELIARRIRAYTPWPGAMTALEGRALKLLRARPENVYEGEGEPGEVVEISAEGFSVACGTGRLRAEEVQAAGRRAMSAAEFLRGARLPVGVRLGHYRSDGGA